MSRSQFADDNDNPNPDCEMPQCVGSPEDETKATRDPSETVVEICESCLDDGLREAVDVLE